MQSMLAHLKNEATAMPKDIRQAEVSAASLVGLAAQHA